MSVSRIALGIRYDGTHYHGWQSQESVSSVQEEVEKAISSVANHPVILTCAGRTDAGVHAAAQVVHFDSDANRSEYSWVFGANSNLPTDISVLWAKIVDSKFHARYCATKRRYRYLLYNYPVRPGILRHAVGWHRRPLDENAMQEAANYLLGEHDFTSFRGAGCQSNTPKRHLFELNIVRQRHMLIIEVCANAFLLHMVRNIVGSLVCVGEGSKPPAWIKAVLEARDRRKAASTISPQGLYLVKAYYPEEYNIPNFPIGPFFLPDL